MKNSINNQELSHFLSSNEIPLEKRRLGFLEIIRKAHNETINSSLYAYFLSCGNNYIETVFIDSLLSILNQKSGKSLRFKEHIVKTEVATSKGRIDTVA